MFEVAVVHLRFIRYNKQYFRFFFFSKGGGGGRAEQRAEETAEISGFMKHK